MDAILSHEVSLVKQLKAEGREITDEQKLERFGVFNLNAKFFKVGAQRINIETVQACEALDNRLVARRRRPGSGPRGRCGGRRHRPHTTAGAAASHRRCSDWGSAARPSAPRPSR